MKLAWMLPRRLAYWCAIRVGCNATQGEWGNESPTDLLMRDALQRWELPPQPRPKGQNTCSEAHPTIEAHPTYIDEPGRNVRNDNDSKFECHAEEGEMKPALKPDECEHDWGLCWCAKCTKELLEANRAYFQRWVDKRLGRTDD